MLRYCAWCGQFQGVVKGKGHQIRKNVCELDTATICPSCFAVAIRDLPEPPALGADARQAPPSPA